MKKRLIALGYYAVYWMGFFFLARLFFISFQYHDAFKNSIGELLGTFLHGAKLDISTTGYFLILPVLIMKKSLFKCFPTAVTNARKHHVLVSIAMLSTSNPRVRIFYDDSDFIPNGQLVNWYNI